MFWTLLFYYNVIHCERREIQFFVSFNISRSGFIYHYSFNTEWFLYWATSRGQSNTYVKKKSKYFYLSYTHNCKNPQSIVNWKNISTSDLLIH